MLALLESARSELNVKIVFAGIPGHQGIELVQSVSEPVQPTVVPTKLIQLSDKVFSASSINYDVLAEPALQHFGELSDLVCHDDQQPVTADTAAGLVDHDDQQPVTAETAAGLMDHDDQQPVTAKTAAGLADHDDQQPVTAETAADLMDHDDQQPVTAETAADLVEHDDQQPVTAETAAGLMDHDDQQPVTAKTAAGLVNHDDQQPVTAETAAGLVDHDDQQPVTAETAAGLMDHDDHQPVTAETAAGRVDHDDQQPVTAETAAGRVDHDDQQPVTAETAVNLMDHDDQPKSLSVDTAVDLTAAESVVYLTVVQDMPVGFEQQTPELFPSTSEDLLAHLQSDVCANPLLLLPLLDFSSEAPVSTLSFNEVTPHSVSSVDNPLLSLSAGVAEAPDHSAVTETPASSHPTRRMQLKRKICSSGPRKKQSSCVGIVTRSGRSSSNTPLSCLSKSPATKRKKKQKQAQGPVNNCVDIPSSSEDSILSCSDDNDEIDLHARSQAKQQKCSRRISNVTSEADKGQKTEKRYTWKDGVKAVNEEKMGFTGNTELDESLLNLQTPLQFFKYFFTDEILCHIAEQTTTYSVQQCPENPSKVSKADIEKFIGVCMLMSLIRLSNCRYYWSTQFRVGQIADVMTYNTFTKLKRFLHL